ncbi:hypothetical protein BGX23_005418, partial [Mortierella sp. AD031]
VSKVYNDKGTFALKTSAVENEDSFDREVEALEWVSGAGMRRLHPNIVGCQSSFSFHGRKNLVLELVKADLDSVWRQGELENDWPRLQRILKEAAEGLAYLHSFDMIHGDLKPDNILLSVKDVAMLTDLGKTQSVVEEPIKDWYGNEDYAPPEEQDRGEWGLKGDVYAFGQVMHALITNRLAVEGASK